VYLKPTRQTWWVWARFEAWLSGLSGWSAPVLFGAFLAWFVGWTLLVGVVFDVVVDERDQAAVADTAGQLVPAVGVLFALLTAFVITNQWNRSRSAEQVVGREADASIRLALASQSPGIDGRRLRSLLVDYLRAVLRAEWETLRHEHAGSPRAADALSRLEQDVRADATAPGRATAVTADLLAAAEGVAVARSDRLNLSGHGLPAPLFLLAFVSGVVLCLNAIAVAAGPDDWVAVVIGGLIVLIALDLALIVSISDPFRGPMRVLPTPIDNVLQQLESGRFGAVLVPGERDRCHGSDADHTDPD
jgi:hypothetical protein